MKFSHYNYIFKSERFGYLLYNAETNAFAELDDELYRQLLHAKETDDVGLLPVQLMDELIKAKILVPDNDQSFFYRKKFRYYFHNFDTSELGFALAPTTFCNFNCPYCYEENRKPIFMTEAVEDQFIAFIKKHESVRNIELTWYGGEPLTNFKTIQRILSKLHKEETIHLRYHSMVTNGYLLDEDKSKYFAEYPLNDIQITIDGSKDLHDQRRILTSGGRTYDTIIHNIDVFLKYNKKTRVIVRVNIDSFTKDAFHRLSQELTERWSNELFSIYPAFVRDYSEGKTCSTKCDALNHKDRVKFYFDLYKKYGIKMQFYPKLSVGGCSATSINYYVVGPSGELYKCWNDIGAAERIIGYLNGTSVANYDVLCQYMAGPTMFDDEQCKECNIFPICNGGCQWMRLKNKNDGKNFELCIDKKEYLEHYLEMHYELQHSSVKSKQDID